MLPALLSCWFLAFTATLAMATGDGGPKRSRRNSNHVRSVRRHRDQNQPWYENAARDAALFDNPRPNMPSAGTQAGFSEADRMKTDGDSAIFDDEEEVNVVEDFLQKQAEMAEEVSPLYTNIDGAQFHRPRSHSWIVERQRMFERLHGKELEALLGIASVSPTTRGLPQHFLPFQMAVVKTFGQRHVLSDDQKDAKLIAMNMIRTISKRDRKEGCKSWFLPGLAPITSIKEE